MVRNMLGNGMPLHQAGHSGETWGGGHAWEDTPAEFVGEAARYDAGRGVLGVTERWGLSPSLPLIPKVDKELSGKRSVTLSIKAQYSRLIMSLPHVFSIRY